jgi:hypothetical protein
MCMQCVTGAAVAATASATGLRAWIGARKGHRPSPRTMKVVTALVVTGGVIAAGLQF